MNKEAEHLTIIQYNSWLKKRSLYAKHMRFILSGPALPLIHTPLPHLKRVLDLKAHGLVLA